MSNATDILVHEHDLIERMLVVLQKAADALEKDPAFSLQPFEQGVDFIRNFADKCHHGKEEDILFKLMGEKGLPVEGGPVGVMLYEHTLARKATAEIADAIEKVKAGDATAVKTIVDNARYYAELLSNHIYKENNILYPMGNQAFSEKDQDFLHKEFNRVEDEIGRDVHESYHRMVDALEKDLNIQH